MEASLLLSNPNQTTLFWDFSNKYSSIHGWLSLIICFLSLLSNSLNIFVLTRPKMVNFKLDYSLAIFPLYKFKFLDKQRNKSDPDCDISLGFANHIHDHTLHNSLLHGSRQAND